MKKIIFAIMLLATSCMAFDFKSYKSVLAKGNIPCMGCLNDEKEMVLILTHYKKKTLATIIERYTDTKGEAQEDLYFGVAKWGKYLTVKDENFGEKFHFIATEKDFTLTNPNSSEKPIGNYTLNITKAIKK